jgi:hypothetical protein
VYRLFEFASFTDENNATSNHVKDTEAYSYVINDNVVRIKNKQADGSVEVTTTPNAWLGFLHENGPAGRRSRSARRLPRSTPTATSTTASKQREPTPGATPTTPTPCGRTATKAQACRRPPRRPSTS